MVLDRLGIKNSRQIILCFVETTGLNLLTPHLPSFLLQPIKWGNRRTVKLGRRLRILIPRNSIFRGKILSNLLLAINRLFLKKTAKSRCLGPPSIFKKKDKIQNLPLVQIIYLEGKAEIRREGVRLLVVKWQVTVKSLI